MIPTAFDYQRANSVEEALSMLADDTKIIAGGHSLLPAMKLRLSTPAKVIDISRIEALQNIQNDGSDLVIGAGCTHAQIAESDLVKETLSMIAEVAGMIGDVQVRNFGTIGGSIAHADPSADWPGALLAADATIVCQGTNGSRSIAANDFFTGFYETALAENEIITAIRIPSNPPGTGKLRSCYKKFVQPASRFAIVGCAVVMRMDRGSTCTHARVAFNGVSDGPYRATAVEQALTSQSVTGDSIAAAADQATLGKMVNEDLFASEEYRTHLAKVFARRAIDACSGDSSAKTAATPDNLTKVEGIGPKIQELLNKAGIHSFAQLANTSVETIQGILKDAGGIYASKNPKTWPAQADMAAKGKWDELKEWQDELDGGV